MLQRRRWSVPAKTFNRNLERQPNSEPLWPLVELTAEDIATLAREGAELCPILRNETHLPDLEYEAQHQLPIIPEPLAFVSLPRIEMPSNAAALPYSAARRQCNGQS